MTGTLYPLAFLPSPATAVRDLHLTALSSGSLSLERLSKTAIQRLFDGSPTALQRLSPQLFETFIPATAAGAKHAAGRSKNRRDDAALRELGDFKMENAAVVQCAMDFSGDLEAACLEGCITDARLLFGSKLMNRGHVDNEGAADEVLRLDATLARGGQGKAALGTRLTLDRVGGGATETAPPFSTVTERRSARPDPASAEGGTDSTPGESVAESSSAASANIASMEPARRPWADGGDRGARWGELRRYKGRDLPAGRIHPSSEFMVHWSYLMVMSVGWYVLYVPYDIAFLTDRIAPASSLLAGICTVLVMCIDLTLALDMLVQFRTCVLDDGALVVSRRSIAKRYLKGWFWFDLMCNASSLAGYMSGTSLYGVEWIKNTRAAKIIRLWKIVRILRLRKLVPPPDDKLDDSLFGAGKLKRLRKPMLALLGSAHIFACGWHAFTPTDSEAEAHLRTHDGEDMPNWMLSYHGGGAEDALALRGRPISERYIECLYWAVVAVSTVGYGDIGPVTDNERMYAGTGFRN
jgi:hypothetical protein